MLNADTVDMITENGGLTRSNGDHLRATMLSVGGSIDALKAFRTGRGRDATQSRCCAGAG